jgi:biopolymer transport protein ExbD
MKKLLVLLVMLTLVFTVFAQEAETEYYEEDQTASQTTESPQPEKEFDLEVTAGIPIHWTDAENDPIEDKSVTSAVALGVGLVFNFNRKVGLALDTDISFARNLQGTSETSSSFYSLVTANVLLGPVIYLYNGSFLRIPLAFGIHYYFYSNDFWQTGIGNQWWKNTDHQFGPGIYLGIQFHFNKSLYILSRTNINFDIARYYVAEVGAGPDSDSDSDFEFIGALSVKPTIGLGIKF